MTVHHWCVAYRGFDGTLYPMGKSRPTVDEAVEEWSDVIRHDWARHVVVRLVDVRELSHPQHGPNRYGDDVPSPTVNDSGNVGTWKGPDSE